MERDDKPVIMIVDDDKNTRDGLQRALQRHYTVLAAESADAALAVLGSGRAVDLLLSDLRMPGTDGLGLLRRVIAQYPRTVCILLTAYGSVETAVDAMKQGAYDFLTKPINLDHLDMLVARALKSRDLEQRVETLESQLNEKFGMENIVGESDAMKQVFEIIRQTAPTQASVLIQGPSGTGKELVAQAIHRLSTRTKGPFVAVHCAALSATLLESELFGHEKGAFTSAIKTKLGKFELANGGTLFLDEIGDMSMSAQSKMLRALQENRITHVGGDKDILVDVRVVAATNKDLTKEIEEGRFRMDLYHRLSVIIIHVPTLNERADDIPQLAEKFVKEICEDYRIPKKVITPKALEELKNMKWEGNIRELRNVIERLIILSETKITDEDVKTFVTNIHAKNTPTDTFEQFEKFQDFKEHMEKLFIEHMLKKHGWNVSKTADVLDIQRSHLYNKIEKFDLRRN